jgi:hypothetical protein
VLDLHSTNNGLPSLLRLWASDKFDMLDQLRETMSTNGSTEGEDQTETPRDHNAQATYFARHASFQLDGEPSSPDERRRSCIHVTKGLGTWTVVSISNWLDKPDVVHIPPMALLPPSRFGWDTGDEDDGTDDISGDHGYHVFAFWSSNYTWLPRVKQEQGHHGDDHTVNKLLNAHATEIFHIKPVTPNEPQYIGSDFHFSCGQELRMFRATGNSLELFLNTDYKRAGRIFVYVPTIYTEGVKVTVNGAPGRWTTAGNTPKVTDNGSPRLVGRVIAIMVVVDATGSPQSAKEGQIQISF